MFLGFYTVNFLGFRGSRVNIQAVPTAEATRKSVHKFWRNSQFLFLTRNVQNLMIFFLTERKKKSISMCQLSKKFTVWKARNTCVFRSLLVTSSIEVFFLILAHTRHIRTYSSRAKKPYRATLNNCRFRNGQG